MKAILHDKEIISLTDATIVFIDNETVVLDEFKEEFAYRNVDMTNMHFIISFEDLQKIISDTQIDTIISDFRMPDKNGIEILEFVRKQNRTIVLVLRTAYTISFNSVEKERCDAANIKILFKHDGFEHMCANLGNYLNKKSTTFDKANNNEKEVAKLKKSPILLRPLPRITRYFNSVLMVEDKSKIELKYKADENWDSITEVPAKVLKILHEKVQCECLINASLKKTQIREFPIILFRNLNKFRENMYVQVKIKLSPGFSCTEIIDGSNLKYGEKFKLENLNELDNFETVKLP